MKFKIGDKVKLIDNNNVYLPLKSKGVIVSADPCLEIYGVSFQGTIQHVFENQLKLKRNKNKVIIKNLEKEVDNLKSEIIKLKEISNSFKGKIVKSNNKLRSEIIEKAKLFVEENIKPNTIREDWNKKGAVKGFKGFEKYTCLIPYFTVNKENRKMYLVLKGVGSDIVKCKLSLNCSHNDVFNEHIGKAILIGRAKGLDVSEFKNCVQPTFCKGQLIDCGFENLLEIDYISKNSISDKAIYFTKGIWMHDYKCKIIDDTNAIYEVE